MQLCQELWSLHTLPDAQVQLEGSVEGSKTQGRCPTFRERSPSRDPTLEIPSSGLHRGGVAFSTLCSKNDVFSPIELKKKLLEIWRCKEAPGLNPLSNCFLSHDNLGFLLKTREIKTLLVLSILLALEGFEMHHISGSHSRPPQPHKIPLRITYGLQGRGRALPSFSPNFPAVWIIPEITTLGNRPGLVWSRWES